MTNNCKTCPVSTGTHKPAEAVHQIDEPQAEALRLAAELVEPIDGFQEPTMLEAAAAAELRRLHARITELGQRLEIDPRHRYDGISARDATIEAQDERIAELESQLEAIGAGGVEPLRKQVAPQTQVVPDERSAFEAWLGIKPCGAAHDFGWAAWKARAALSATQPAAQGMEQDAALLDYLIETGAAINSTMPFDRKYLTYPDGAIQKGTHTTARAAIAAALAAQAKQGGAA